MTAGSYGQMRATDTDRDKVHSLLQAAYADGRLTWDEFDTRSSDLLAAKTYDQLSVLTTDLRRPAQVVLPAGYPAAFGARPRTNQVAIIAMVCGLIQFAFLGPIASIPAIICGHVARSQIRRTGEDGDGMALAGLILGYVGIVIPLAIVAIILAGSS